MSDYSGTIFARGVPPAIDNPRWDDFANAFVPNQVQLTEHKRMVKTVMAELAVPTGAKLLEVGAGIGIMALEMANQGLDVWDLDIVPANVDLVERVSGSLGLGVNVIYGDSVRLPFSDNSFDAVFSKSVFEHIHDQEKALDEQIRVLKPGARMMILDGNLLNPKCVYDLLVRRPKVSKGRQGGLRWLLTKNRAYDDYGMGWHGKEEDIKTVYWWRRKVRKRPRVKCIKITTTRRLFYPGNLKYKIFEPVAGMVAVVLEKVA